MAEMIAHLRQQIYEATRVPEHMLSDRYTPDRMWQTNYHMQQLLDRLLMNEADIIARGNPAACLLQPNAKV